MLEGDVAIPKRKGGTRCLVRVIFWEGDTAAIITEVPDNPGLPVEATFAEIAEVVRDSIPIGVEPLWIRTWPGHSLAEHVLHRRKAFDTHLMIETTDGWRSRPLPAAAAEQLMVALARRDAAASRRALQLRQRHDDGHAHLGQRLAAGEGLHDAEDVVSRVGVCRGAGEQHGRENGQGEDCSDLQG